MLRLLTRLARSQRPSGALGMSALALALAKGACGSCVFENLIDNDSGNRFDLGPLVKSGGNYKVRRFRPPPQCC